MNTINKEKLNQINSKEFVIHAVAKTKTQGNINPKLDNSGCIRNTPLQHVLKLKVGARIMLTYNIDTCDSLTNGTFGEVIGIEFDQSNEVSRVLVQFDNEISGRERRNTVGSYNECIVL